MTFIIAQADSQHIPLADESVQCVVTSPPYWGLRDYGTAKWEGGDPACDHQPPKSRKGGESAKQNSNAGSWGTREWLVCDKCGAVRVDAQLGLEPTPEAYVANLEVVFREVRRVLKPDGVVWLNLGDSFASGKGTCYNPGGGEHSLGQERKAAGAHPLDRGNISTLTAIGLKPKDLVGIPWRVAFALQADGWWLRSDIIWHKPNPMPESVTDRPTKAHEYVFLLTKSARYYWDGDAVKEAAAESTNQRDRYARTGYAKETYDGVVNPLNPSSGAFRDCRGERNRRTVWTIATKPFREAHFATMPPALVEPCILAGSKSGDVVLDPFAGSGTVGVVALRHGRRFVGLDLSRTYCEMARRRIVGDMPILYGNVEAATCERA